MRESLVWSYSQYDDALIRRKPAHKKINLRRLYNHITIYFILLCEYSVATQLDTFKTHGYMVFYSILVRGGSLHNSYSINTFILITIPQCQKECLRFLIHYLEQTVHIIKLIHTNTFKTSIFQHMCLFFFYNTSRSKNNISVMQIFL